MSKRLFSPTNDSSECFELEGATAEELLDWIVERHDWVYNDRIKGKVFAGPSDRAASEPPPKTAEEILLEVPYYSQRDSKVPGEWYRMCFSSSVAMMVATVRPKVLTSSPNADDEHLMRVKKYGDTTQAHAQISALAHYGIPALFRQDMDWDDVDRALMRNHPVPIGILIHGPVSAPRGGGHYICVIGKTETGYVCHDPYGELDLVEGKYLHANGRARHYSKENLTKRWRPGGSGGWGIVILDEEDE